MIRGRTVAGAAMCVASATIAATALSGASAAPQGGATPRFRGPVAVGGLCDEQAAYHAVVRQKHDVVVAKVYLRHAGVHARWDYTSKVKTEYDDGTGVVGTGDGSVRGDANGHFALAGATPAGGARYEFVFHFRRADTGERCYILVKA
jgi:hypothetical protein